MRSPVKISKGPSPQKKDKVAQFVTGVKASKTPKPRSLTPQPSKGKK